jgi:hypothetical protein
MRYGFITSSPRRKGNPLTSPRKKKFKAIPSVSKIRVTVFWDSEGVILIDVLPRGHTIIWDVYVETLKRPFQRVSPHKNVNDRSASSPRRKATHKSAYPRGHHRASVDCPASSALQPGSGSFQLPSSFQPLKDAIRGKKFEDDEEVISEVKMWLRQRPAVAPQRYTGSHTSMV